MGRRADRPGRRGSTPSTTPTSPSPGARPITPARAAGFRVVGYVFQSSVPASFTRNAGRPEAEQVPAKTIGGTKKRMEWPRRDEGFDALHYVRISPAGGFLIEE